MCVCASCRCAFDCCLKACTLMRVRPCDPEGIKNGVAWPFKVTEETGDYFVLHSDGTVTSTTGNASSSDICSPGCG
jgi:hypothetical protein